MNTKLVKKLLDTLKKGKSVKEVAWWLDYYYNVDVIDRSDYDTAYEILDQYGKVQ